jgi:hypothetical protein
MRPPLLAVALALLPACTAAAAEDIAAAAAQQPAVSTKLQSLLPKYNSPRTVVTVDRRETDRPRNVIVRLPKEMLPPESIAAPAAAVAENSDPAPNGVVRLPRYEVREPRLPNFKEREILRPRARVDLHFKRHPGLRIGNIFGLNRGIARAMIAEQDDYDRRQEMAELLAFQSFADSQPRPKNESD